MKINPRTHKAYSLFHDAILAFQRAESTGVRVDVPYMEEQKVLLTERINKLELEFKNTNFYKHWNHVTSGKVNIHSGEQ